MTVSQGGKGLHLRFPGAIGGKLGSPCAAGALVVKACEMPTAVRIEATPPASMPKSPLRGSQKQIHARGNAALNFLSHFTVSCANPPAPAHTLLCQTSCLHFVRRVSHVGGENMEIATQGQGRLLDELKMF